MCNKAVENYPYASEYVSKCCKTQQMCDKAVYTYPFGIKVVPECYKTKRMCHRAVHRCFFVSDVISDKYKAQEICNLAVSLYFQFIVYCLYKYITQKMCDETVNDSLVALKLIPDWFVTSKMINKLFTALHADESILYFNEASRDAAFSYSEMGIVDIDLNNINLDDNFDEEDPNTIILIRIWLGILSLKNAKNLKKS